MGWRGRGGGRGGSGPWPGRGPFSYLPPWQRPGWLFGRGACWWLYPPYQQTTGPPTANESAVPPMGTTAPFAPTLTKEQETQLLEHQMTFLQAQLNAIKKRLDEVSK